MVGSSLWQKKLFFFFFFHCVLVPIKWMDSLTHQPNNNGWKWGGGGQGAKRIKILERATSMSASPSSTLLVVLSFTTAMFVLTSATAAFVLPSSTPPGVRRARCACLRCRPRRPSSWRAGPVTATRTRPSLSSRNGRGR